jgi:preprotein translocase subunit SecD
MTKIQKTLIGTTVAVLVGVGLYEAHQAARFRQQVQALQQQQIALQEQLQRISSENKSLSSRLAQAGHPPAASTERLRELLRLRGEIGVLRRQQRELEQALAALQPRGSENAGSPASAPQPPNAPAPFQVQLVADAPGDNTESMTNRAGGTAGSTLQLDKTPLLDYTAIRSVDVTLDSSSGQAAINVEFSEEGKELFAAVTRDHIDKRLAIVLNGEVYATPVIRSEITGGKAQITGSFTEDEARRLAAGITEAIRYQ